MDAVIGGWQLAGNVIWASGRPFTVYSGINTVGNVVQSTADCNGCTRDIGQLVLESGKNFWFDAATRARFTAPAAGSIGNSGRNFFLDTGIREGQFLGNGSSATRREDRVSRFALKLQTGISNS